MSLWSSCTTAWVVVSFLFFFVVSARSVVSFSVAFSAFEADVFSFVCAACFFVVDGFAVVDTGAVVVFAVVFFSVVSDVV